MSVKETTLRDKANNLRAQVISSQGSFLQASVCKLLRTNAFGKYMNACGSAINTLATIVAIELISLDFLDLNIKRSDYGYDTATRDQFGWRLVETMLQVPDFPLLESFKSSDHIFTSDEILKSKMDEDRMFKNLDKAGHVCSLGLPMSPPKLNLLVTLPQNLHESKEVTLSNMSLLKMLFEYLFPLFCFFMTYGQLSFW